MSASEKGMVSDKKKMEIRIIGGPYDHITTVLEELRARAGRVHAILGVDGDRSPEGG